jgi:hypothetical protein
LVLIFLVSLAFLSLAIQAELERRQDSAQPAGGSCPSCVRPVEADWLLCPHCRTLSRKAAPAAAGTFHLASLCPDCGFRRGGGEMKRVFDGSTALLLVGGTVLPCSANLVPVLRAVHGRYLPDSRPSAWAAGAQSAGGLPADLPKLQRRLSFPLPLPLRNHSGIGVALLSDCGCAVEHLSDK